MKKGNPIARAASVGAVSKTKQKGALAPRKAGKAAAGPTATTTRVKTK